ncbi:MAG: D-glycero-beta-D-manno-heptose 1-phosphate adenylyltransferase [Elusimicrobiaceae bacterium]|nr:D-glycero-beta-D-manno-heptose 1-phosphate adenylyltransferase [Elusimicrobiaceae bacterium]MBT3954986.1 D-glycero-beta-D-manno-heptose 1-phosphate adenylyltransferase [Elusimicrobiaceae bacterium]MBT4008122.1 D-glycero-beta-D-manno-heptose 1-phosphate adenylyltransferase [Elusimicrobiaceae bacterium]MBT4402682.1 D-glycero-beta-D-manno-heptose 1-phosphate adenylyltransferase [Elusimicrobiaceae bacterium]MBT4440034.1 D-glycero-beta-D-manno-heptose 1-phosphate adenylyltransferase [Elusimicrobi
MKMKKLKTKNNLLAFLRKAKKQGKSVVFTNGCFDILHAGHIKILEFCKNKGDILVVGLNTDASVRKLKGKGRPINKQKDRALVLGALESIDAVCFFGEQTPHNLITLIKPDILVKGGDYSEDEVVGNKVAKKVIIYPLVKGKSTSGVIKKINNRK